MDADRARELLRMERERIERALGSVGNVEENDSEEGQDAAAGGSELYQDEFDDGVEEDLREQLAGLERAEARLAAGTYGRSIESGEPIPDERLEALPTAELTVEEERARARP